MNGPSDDAVVSRAVFETTRNKLLRGQRIALARILGCSTPMAQFDEVCREIQAARRPGIVLRDLCKRTLSPTEGEPDPLLGHRLRRVVLVGPLKLKSPARVIESLVTSSDGRPRTWQRKGGFKQWLGDKPWWHHVPDLARFRIVCNLLSDVERAKVALEALCRDHGCGLELKDFINDVQQARKRGARSLHVLVRPEGSAGRVVEIQVMTQLQEAWDAKDHVLAYEVTRSGGTVSDRQIQLLRSLSDMLYVADVVFERLYREH